MSFTEESDLDDKEFYTDTVEGDLTPPPLFDEYLQEESSNNETWE
ncbi:hypothetical protein [Sansalvadorimonas verongulae]|nr:hypothetical protein [Sansalvadorimonas verongulae]